LITDLKEILDPIDKGENKQSKSITINRLKEISSDCLNVSITTNTISVYDYDER